MGAPQSVLVPDRPPADAVPLPARRLGRTELRVPIVGCGTGPSGYGLSDSAAIDLLHHAVDLGVSYLDTAPSYGRAQRQTPRGAGGTA